MKSLVKSLISALEVCGSYRTERADKVTTRFGETILLGIRETPDERMFKVFLPQRYATVFKDDNQQAIKRGPPIGILCQKDDAQRLMLTSWL